MSLPGLAQYKYHINPGGGGGSTWSGTIVKLAMPGLLFHHYLTPTKDYFHDWLVPWNGIGGLIQFETQVQLGPKSLAQS